MIGVIMVSRHYNILDLEMAIRKAAKFMNVILLTHFGQILFWFISYCYLTAPIYWVSHLPANLQNQTSLAVFSTAVFYWIIFSSLTLAVLCLHVKLWSLTAMLSQFYTFVFIWCKLEVFWAKITHHKIHTMFLGFWLQMHMK